MAEQKLRILALDTATCTGYAHSSGVSGTWDLSVRADESSGMRLFRLQSKLVEIKNSAGIDLIVFEASRNLRYGHAIRVAAQLQGVLELWCVNNGIEYRGYSPKEIKKHAVGSGAAKKGAMIAAAKKKWPDIEIEDDNHADALWLLDLAQKEYGSLAILKASAK